MGLITILNVVCHPSCLKNSTKYLDNDLPSYLSDSPINTLSKIASDSFFILFHPHPSN